MYSPSSSSGLVRLQTNNTADMTINVTYALHASPDSTILPRGVKSCWVKPWDVLQQM